MATVHNSPFRGVWYPDRASELKRLLEDRFEESRRRMGPHLFPGAIGYVTPHAGPAYSGTVASAVYRSLEQQQPERIVILAFPHRGGLRGVAVPDVDAIETPLGTAAIDTAFIGGFPRLDEEALCDHSLEIQLPFLQRAVPRARLTPLYVGRMHAEERIAAARRLAARWQPGVVFLASSDFTHYGRSFGYEPFPADDQVSDRLQELDFDCIEAAGSLDSELFLETLGQRRATVCGPDPITLLLDVLRLLAGDDLYQATLDYQTSGEITDDFRHSVSYAALGYFRRPAFDLDAADCEILLDGAAAALAHLRETGVPVPLPVHGGSAALSARRGAFVSLHHGQELLGCLGNCTGCGPLSAEVPRLAVSAAMDDPRFRPAAAFEGTIDMEISVLTPFRRIRRASQLCVGKHGGFLRFGELSGLLLPQVAAGRGWSSEQFLQALARKSQLESHAWRNPVARLSVFEAQVFSRPGLPARS